MSTASAVPPTDPHAAADASEALHSAPLIGLANYVGLSAQIPLSVAELERARHVIAWIRRVRDERLALLRQAADKAEFVNAQARWSANRADTQPTRHESAAAANPLTAPATVGFTRAVNELDAEPDEPSSILYDGYKRVCRGDEHVLQHLRLFAQVFTGYRLMSMDSSRVAPIPASVPADLDAQLAAKPPQPPGIEHRFLQILHALPHDLRLSPPRRLAEIGWNLEGVLFNWDTMVYLERLALLNEHGVIDRLRAIARTEQRPVRILEIGGGYGGLAYFLRQAIPNSRYAIVDLPESLVFSGIYGTVTDPHGHHRYAEASSPIEMYAANDPGQTFVPNFLFDDLVQSGSRFDLAINTLSMSEMSQAQVEHYCRGLVTLLGNDGLFFEQNQDNRGVGALDARLVIRPFFQHQRPLTSTLPCGLTQGAANIWSSPNGRVA